MGQIYSKDLYEPKFLKGKEVRKSRITVDGYGREWLELIFTDNSVLRVVSGMTHNPLYVMLDSEVHENVKSESLVSFSINN